MSSAYGQDGELKDGAAITIRLAFLRTRMNCFERVYIQDRRILCKMEAKVTMLWTGLGKNYWHPNYAIKYRQIPISHFIKCHLIVGLFINTSLTPCTKQIMRQTVGP